MGDRPHQAKSIFLAALEEHTPEQWPAFLEQACAGDVPLRAEVERLLRARSEMGSFHEAPRPALLATVDAPINERPGTVIGPYKLLEQIGEGGFGVVFMAEQTRPVRRKVALKVLKPGMDTRQVVARFEAERQALALMDHANIAKVLEAGTTSGEPGGLSPGRPYFAMELVRGVSITAYCDQNGLNTRDRLKLFVTVCQAVQHAHQKGIIHRDIKPSNVLVTLHDGTPVVKVIDFGIAKALGQQLTDKTLCTGFAQLIGTPLYMSPEQAELSGLDIDTRSDIYSLGVLLYELLTGTTPFDGERLREAGYDEMRRIIREEEPARPSTRVSTMGQAAMVVSERRRSDPRRLCQLFRGELDWVVMKALEKDRIRRYETASAIAADVQRYLNDEPVAACPPSAWYLFGKFARRRRQLLTMAAVVSVALVLTAGAIGWAVRDRAEREESIRRDQRSQEAMLRRENAVRETVLDDEAARATDDIERLIGAPDWPAARTPLERAERMLTGAGRTRLPSRLVELRRDLDLLTRLEKVLDAADAKKADDLSAAEIVAVNTGFTEAFREFGIDVPALEASEAAQRIRARPIRAELAAALDYWAMKRRWAADSEHIIFVISSPLGAEKARKDYDSMNQGRPPPNWQHLLQVAKLADPDPWLDRLRDGLIQDGDVKTLMALAESAPVDKLRPSHLLLLGEALFKKDPRASVTFLRKAQQAYPNDPRLNDSLGEIYYGLLGTRQADEALRFWTVALAVRRDSVYLNYRVGMVRMSKTAGLEAAAQFSRAIELDPDCRVARLGRGNALTYLGRSDGIGDFSHVIDKNPKQEGYWFARGQAYHCLHQWHKAIADFSQAIRLQPSFWTAYSGRANCHAALGLWAQAADDFEHVVAKLPLNDGMWLELAAYRAAAGDRQEYGNMRRRLLEQLG